MVGHLIDFMDVVCKMKEYSNKRFTILRLQPDIFVDATLYGNELKSIRHSCDPNCEAQAWWVSGLPRLKIIATRDIKENDELTLDFSSISYDFKVRECRCGAKQCKKFIIPQSTTPIPQVTKNKSKTYLTEEALDVIEKPLQQWNTTEFRALAEIHNRPSTGDFINLLGVNSRNAGNFHLDLIEFIASKNNIPAYSDIVQTSNSIIGEFCVKQGIKRQLRDCK
ncbi:hypothetical protein B4U79_06073, partial [Dinothrombium tinctorium]